MQKQIGNDVVFFLTLPPEPNFTSTVRELLAIATFTTCWMAKPTRQQFVS
ncbi:unnamed protein product [Brassica oleracea var. botrytis]